MVPQRQQSLDVCIARGADWIRVTTAASLGTGFASSFDWIVFGGSAGNSVIELSALNDTKGNTDDKIQNYATMAADC